MAEAETSTETLKLLKYILNDKKAYQESDRRQTLSGNKDTTQRSTSKLKTRIHAFTAFTNSDRNRPGYNQKHQSETRKDYKKRITTNIRGFRNRSRSIFHLDQTKMKTQTTDECKIGGERELKEEKLKWILPPVTLPAIYTVKPHPLQRRDFSAPCPRKVWGTDDWDSLEKCRYLRPALPKYNAKEK